MINDSIAQFIIPSIFLNRLFNHVGRTRRTHASRMRLDRLRRAVATSPKLVSQRYAFISDLVAWKVTIAVLLCLFVQLEVMTPLRVAICE